MWWWYTFHRLHIPTQSRTTSRQAFPSRAGLHAALNKWNAQQPGVWQYWEAIEVAPVQLTFDEMDKLDTSR